MKAYVFPGQGAQFPGMGKNMYEENTEAKERFEEANEILGFNITRLMFDGTEEDLRQTKVTQPAIYLHSVILAGTVEDFHPEMVAGHSLGEFSSLVANKTLSFTEGLKLVSKRATAMQKACEAEPSTMAAILGLDDNVVEEVCEEIPEVVVPANYNSPGQIVISGSLAGIDDAIMKLTKLGAKRAIKLTVGGAFHSPLMEPARQELETAIMNCFFATPICPVYQNFTALPTSDPDTIRTNLVAQLTAPVRWTQTIQHMLKDGASSFTEVGPGKVLQGLIKKVDKEIPTASA
jgi:[acyl-carrier-protein] S-malonyltransferase